jgi:hypothetical protein
MKEADELVRYDVESMRALRGRYFTYAYIHPHSLALPIDNTGKSIDFRTLTKDGDKYGFAKMPAPLRIEIPAGTVLYRYQRHLAEPATLWVYRTTQPIPNVLYGRAAALKEHLLDPKGSDGGGIQFCIDDDAARETMLRRPATHADHSPDWR